MKKLLQILTFISVFLIVLSSFDYMQIIMKEQEKGIQNYVSVNNPNYSLSLIFQSDSIVGYHCFIGENGLIIDCCPDNDEYSIVLKRQEANIYGGKIESCYDYIIRDINVIKMDGILKFIFSSSKDNNSHILIENNDTLVFSLVNRSEVD